MNYFSFDRNGVTFERVTKRTALKALKAGKKVIALPCNVNPCYMAYQGMTGTTLKEMGPRENEAPAATFERYCNACIYYNCTPETGAYLSYYIA